MKQTRQSFRKDGHLTQTALDLLQKSPQVRACPAHPTRLCSASS